MRISNSAQIQQLLNFSPLLYIRTVYVPSPFLLRFTTPCFLQEGQVGTAQEPSEPKKSDLFPCNKCSVFLYHHVLSTAFPFLSPFFFMLHKITVKLQDTALTNHHW
jgi:hypothetical protein